MNVEINPEVLKEFQYLVHLHKRHGAPNAFDNVADLIAYVLAAVADGSRRPGAWERSMLESMGLVAECDEHQQYRAHHGLPNAADEAQAIGECLSFGVSVPARSGGLADLGDRATTIADIERRLLQAVAALRSVLAVFDNQENRDPERRPREFVVLQGVYQALGRPWPAVGSTTAE
jgi:hypothetical protein